MGSRLEESAQGRRLLEELASEDAYEVARAAEELWLADFSGSLSDSDRCKALGPLVKALERHPSDARVQDNASHALGNICMNSQERSAKAADLGALEAVVKALERHPSDAGVQGKASLALGNICANSQERSAKAADLGALEAVVKALERHPSDAGVQGKASLALGNICANSQERSAKAADLGALEALVKALEHHPRAGVQRRASLALGNMCANSQERRAKAADLGALEALVKALERHPSDAGVQGRASRALGILRSNSQQSQPTDGEAGGARPIPAPMPESASTAPAAQEVISRAEPEAEKKLRDAMNGRDADQLKLAIQAAGAAQVRPEVFLRVLQDSQPSRKAASLQLSLDVDTSDIPAGIHICQALDRIYQCFQTPEVASGDEFLKACCQERGASHVFGALMADAYDHAIIVSLFLVVNCIDMNPSSKV